MGKATIGHLDPEFIALMEEIKSLLRYAFKTNKTHHSPGLMKTTAPCHQAIMSAPTPPGLSVS